MQAIELLVVDLADENAELREQFVAFRELAKTALEELADLRRALETAKRRNAALIDEIRALRERTAA